MNINLKANFELTPFIRVFIEKRIAKLEKLANCAGGAVNGWVEIEKTSSKEKNFLFRAEIQLNVPGISLRAESHAENWRAAFRSARDKIKNELVKYKGRKCSNR